MGRLAAIFARRNVKHVVRADDVARYLVRMGGVVYRTQQGWHARSGAQAADYGSISETGSVADKKVGCSVQMGVPADLLGYPAADPPPDDSIRPGKVAGAQTSRWKALFV